MKTLINAKTGTFWKTATCVALSMFYFAMLAYPFGVTSEGYVPHKALIAVVIFFAISIPAWIVNVRKLLLNPEEEEEYAGEAVAHEAPEAGYVAREGGSKIGELAMMKKWLGPKEISQILFCQRGDNSRFGEIAVQRNYLTKEQVESLLTMQPAATH